MVGFLFVVVVLGVLSLIGWQQSQKIRLHTELPSGDRKAKEALQTVERHLRAIGYRLMSGSSTRSTFRYAEGRWWAGDRAERPHRIRVKATGATVVFEVTGFQDKLGGEEEAVLTRRLNGVGHALRAAAKTDRAMKRKPPKVPKVVHKQTVERQVVVARCKFCGELVPVDLEKCQNCGAGKFV